MQTCFELSKNNCYRLIQISIEILNRILISKLIELYDEISN